MSQPSGETVTYSFIQKSLQTYKDVLDDRIDMIDGKIDDLKVHLSSMQMEVYKPVEFTPKAQNIENYERVDQLSQQVRMMNDKIRSMDQQIIHYGSALDDIVR